MTAIMTFLISVYVTALALCVLAFYANTPVLYTIGAVIALTSALVAMTPRILDYLNPKEEDQ